jgi:hypothetical protein
MKIYPLSVGGMVVTLVSDGGEQVGRVQFEFPGRLMGERGEVRTPVQVRRLALNTVRASDEIEAPLREESSKPKRPTGPRKPKPGAERPMLNL